MCGFFDVRICEVVLSFGLVRFELGYLKGLWTTIVEVELVFFEIEFDVEIVVEEIRIPYVSKDYEKH